MVEASKIEQDKKKDAAQGDRPRFERLRHIELEIQEQIEAGKLNEVSAPADYEKMEWVEKNQSKYFATFPYPYMNGYLHLGKFY
jgi:leucyl-tRNA synthetase